MGLLAFIMAYALFAFIFYILQVIAYWKIFTKAGEEGWKSIIPIYNGYVQYRLTWDVQYFWVALGLAVGGGILNSFGGIVGVIGSLALLGTALMNVVALYKLFHTQLGVKTLLDGGRRRTKNLYGVVKRTVPAGQVRQ